MNCSRRRFISGTASMGIGQVAGIGLAGQPSETDGRSPVTRRELDEIRKGMTNGRHLTCVRTPESNDGPYYYPSSPTRRNITEGHKGMRLRLGITVASANIPGSACAALRGAVVDVWQADADGMYSNVGSDLQAVDTVGQTFMRGHQPTNRDGYVEFETVVPGWELLARAPPAKAVVRATHIHVKVFHENKVLTTQLYLPDDFLDGLYASVDPYRSHRTMTAPGMENSVQRKRNVDDGAFVRDQSKPLEVHREGNGIVAQATIGVVTLGSLGVRSLFR